MTKSIYLNGGKQSVDFHADVKMVTKPTISQEYHHQGTRFYKTTDGRTFNADTFDKMWTPCKVDKIRVQKYKGKNPHSFIDLLNE